MKNFNAKIGVFLIVMLVSNNAFAGINKSLGNVWKSLGGDSVVNESGYYKGQRGGHYTMGSMYFARQKKNRPLVSVNFPEIDFDKSCYSQGVLNFGGISFIDGDELKNKLQSIVQEAGMMYVYLGINSISPVIGSTLEEVYSKLQEIGGFLSDECQAAKQIVGMTGDMMSQHSATAQNIFSRFNPAKGRDSDLSSSLKKYPNGKTEALSGAAAKDESLMLEDINLAWQALDKLNIKDKSLKELMMTISGTIIIKAPKNDSQKPSFQYVSSKITHPSVLESLLKGGTTKSIISCQDDSKCLNVSDSEKTIKREESFEFKVTEYFEKFREALEEDKELEKGAQTFLAKSGLPIYKIYDAIYQYTNANPEYEQGILIDIVAWHILYNYLSDMLKEISEASNNLQIAAAKQLQDFRTSLIEARKVLTSHEMKDMSRYKLQLFLIKRAETYEELIANETAQIFTMIKS